MTREQIEQLIVGKTVKAITWRVLDRHGKKLKEDDLMISDIVFTDGSSLELSGSGQYDDDFVWVDFHE